MAVSMVICNSLSDSVAHPPPDSRIRKSKRDSEKVRKRERVKEKNYTRFDCLLCVHVFFFLKKKNLGSFKARRLEKALTSKLGASARGRFNCLPPG